MMFGVQATKNVVKEIIPPLVTVALQRVRPALRFNGRRTTHDQRHDAAGGSSIVRQARRNFENAAGDGGAGDLLPSRVWTTFYERHRAEISKFSTIREAIYHAQIHQGGFDNREPLTKHHPKLTFGLYEKTLKCEFPRYSHVIETMGDSKFSRGDTLLEHRGRLISNVFFSHLRHVLQCLTYVKEPQTICEIGGGYGGLARLWLENPIHCPRTYVIIDFPESLYFAEVFLRANFQDLSLLYVTDHMPLEPDIGSKYTVILCPVQHLDALPEMRLDLVINTGSLQEMTDEWVDYWMEWVSRQNCRWFYSVNYFAQPLSAIGEGANIWSPRLDANWIARLQRFTPPLVRMQSARNYAEILLEKVSDEPPALSDALARYDLIKQRAFDDQAFLEAMDVVRVCPDEDIMWHLLCRCLDEMQTTPKEAYYLAEHLARYASEAFHGENGSRLADIREKLHRVRSEGIEDWVPSMRN